MNIVKRAVNWYLVAPDENLGHNVAEFIDNLVNNNFDGYEIKIILQEIIITMTKKAEKAIEILNEDRCMIESILSKEERKYFSNNSFTDYLIRAVKVYSDKCENKN